jgi:hypothetical protein
VTTPDYRSIAKAVLKLAGELDHRMAMPTDERAQLAKIDAWTAVLTGHVWPTEAETAVVEHYRNPAAFPLMPGDVIAYCRNQPVWSSLDHARDWIMRVGVQNPYSGAIEAYSGVTEPIIEIPPQIAREDHRRYLIERLHMWAAPRLDELAAAIVARRHEPWWLS